MKRLAPTLPALLLTGTVSAAPLLEFGPSEPTWYLRNDTVMGGVSSSRLRVSDGVLTFSGQVRLENNGGFSGIRSAASRYDLSGFKNVVLRVRGDGKRYALQLGNSNRSGVTYRNEFNTVAGRWIEVRVPLASLRPVRSGEPFRGAALDLRRVVFFGLVIGNGRAEQFALEVDWIRGE
ncbi:CIA30 family protein [Deinococcus sp.]|uniref:CIA30 family protein n=1 Tax=Deinococcus sp. TaxID=47478 RepID=UPI003B5945C8